MVDSIITIMAEYDHRARLDQLVWELSQRHPELRPEQLNSTVRGLLQRHSKGSSDHNPNTHADLFVRLDGLEGDVWALKQRPDDFDWWDGLAIR